MSWKTNHKTRQRFPNGMETPQEHELKGVGWNCDACNKNFPSSAQQFELEGRQICGDCKKIEQSGVLDRETIYSDSPKPEPTVVALTNHTIKPGESACAGCGSTKRNLCPHCMKCWSCRAPDCPRK
jgi:hypothetical protein